ncbi:unnamed protein product [Rotaria sp. Silwood1]|nr:unnamed protein product [Rotaria sp. Silwood1]CAF0999238.1 unnamed protein product [Rotaria sp. Silwood1]CAF3407495.1 unnamed protein product [Rotaria sp. Silwood1]CAF3421990.1 unnamed protein product [Rotaria sp. Silwood1]CAF4540376.1 unnamed protein product [Rotaria sp. Silwood1]
MLRTLGNSSMRQTTRILRCPRFVSTNPTAGSINEAHDKFAEREQALENAYFRKHNEELLAKLRHHHQFLENQSDEIEREQKRIEEEIKRLEKHREELMKIHLKKKNQ